MALEETFLFRKKSQSKAWGDFPVFSKKKQRNILKKMDKKEEDSFDRALRIVNEETTVETFPTEDKHILVNYLKKKYKKCQYPGCENTEYLTVEHIIPARLLKLLGMTRAQSMNIKYKKIFTIFCKSCNQRTANIFDFNQKNRKLLIHFIKKLG